ncbi:MAG: POT family proton-dependent oligopeptide transporter [Vicingaceae bacterium]|jgi:POT family proton-dependent oligopeptide transporter
MDIALWILIISWVFVLAWVPFIIYSNRKLHPKALFILFFAEMWERFSYYGMRALLILYMVSELFKDLSNGEAKIEALGIYGSYTAMVYLFPVVGGLLADKVLGYRKAILFGGTLMMAGHFALALEGMVFGGNAQLFFLSLAFIIVGNGFFKPNISSFLGDFYGLNDSRKDGAFTIFYMGVNIGALLASVTCGYLGESADFGWHYGFGLAGIGMLLGLLIFWIYAPKTLGKKGINPASLENFPEIIEKDAIKLLEGSKEDREIALKVESENFKEIKNPKLKKNQILTYIGSILFIPICSLFLDLSDLVYWGLIIISIGILGYILYLASKEESKEAGQRLWVIVILFIFHSIFWALFEQAGGSITLFTLENVDRVVLGSEIPTSIFQLLNAFFIMTLAPLFSIMWIKLRANGKEPSTPMKFVLGLAQLALGFGVIVLAAQFAVEGLVPIVFLIVMYLFHTTGELSLSPVGLSMITKLSPKRMVGFIMGVWFLSISLANKMAGKIGELTAGSNLGENATSIETLEVYSSTYLTWGVFVVGSAALVLFFLVPTLRKWMNGIH